MTWITIGLAITIFLTILFAKAKYKGQPKSLDYPYSMQDVLFSPAERSFLGVLKKAVGDNVQILGKVRVADVITPKKGLSRSEWQKAFNKISGKHFDFVLCNKDDLSILCVVELDDSSHQLQHRKERDVFLVGACNSSSLPLIQIKAKAHYNISEINELLSPYLANLDVDSSSSNVALGKTISKETQPENSHERKLCPKCSSHLVRRAANKGNNAGKEFLACSSFPKCRHIEAVNT